MRLFEGLLYGKNSLSIVNLYLQEFRYGNNAPQTTTDNYKSAFPLIKWAIVRREVASIKGVITELFGYGNIE